MSGGGPGWSGGCPGWSGGAGDGEDEDQDEAKAKDEDEDEEVDDEAEDYDAKGDYDPDYDKDDFTKADVEDIDALIQAHGDTEETTIIETQDPIPDAFKVGSPVRFNRIDGWVSKLNHGSGTIVVRKKPGFLPSPMNIQANIRNKGYSNWLRFLHVSHDCTGVS